MMPERSNETTTPKSHWDALETALRLIPLPSVGGRRVACPSEFMFMWADDSGRLHFKHTYTRRYLIVRTDGLQISHCSDALF